MGVERDSSPPSHVSGQTQPGKRLSAIVFAFIVLPVLVGIAWVKAPQFDPFTMSFFTKTYVEPSASMPGQLRIIGWVIIGIGALLGVAAVKGVRERIGHLRESLLVLWTGCLIAAFGGAFFVAAESAQIRIGQEKPVEKT